MIYIFQGCGAACRAPCVCCKELGKAFDGCCKGCGEACHRAAKALSDCWAPIVQNPLGFYVIGTWLSMGLCVACCAAAIPEAARQKCREIVFFCIIDVGIAVVHAGFAFYIQRCLVKALSESTGEGGATHRDITSAAKHLAKYDIGFCLYFFFFIAALGYNVYGLGAGAKCAVKGYQMGAIGLMLCYGCGSFWYGLCWFCGQCCYGKAEKRGVVKTRADAPVPTAPAAGASAPAPAPAAMPEP